MGIEPSAAIIRHPMNGKTAFLTGRVQVVTGGRISGMSGPFDGQECDGRDGGNHGAEHDNDEPCGAICGLRRGLGDSHGVDESVRNEEDELHVSLTTDWRT